MSLKIIPLATLLASQVQSKAIVDFFSSGKMNAEGLFDRSCRPTLPRMAMNCVKSYKNCVHKMNI